MSTSLYHIEGFGVDISKDMKIYDSSDKEYYENKPKPSYWTDDLTKLGLQYIWDEWAENGNGYIGIFNFIKMEYGTDTNSIYCSLEELQKRYEVAKKIMNGDFGEVKYINKVIVR